MTEKKPRGRPISDNPLGRAHPVRFTEADYELVAKAAGAAGVPVTQWIREKAIAAAKRVIK